MARDTLLRFLKILGDVCGDAALTMGARGGVYLCGGILPRLLDWLPRSRFREAFAAKVLDPAKASVIVVGDAKAFGPALAAEAPGLQVIPAADLDLDSPTLKKAQ